ncbi:hypothetical protein EV426DRAFT_710594 [Tirmania nivea]|nr:hypothetical protein EV426DRAFT_710594 [Tirmania nivea]
MSRATAKEDQSTFQCKNPEYRKWRRHLKAYALSNGITGKHGTSAAVWEAFQQYALNSKHGLPASGRKLVMTAKGDKEGDKARERFHYLLLDCLKKDRETETKEGLSSAKRRWENAANDSGEETTRPTTIPFYTVRVAIIDLNNNTDINPVDGNYYWANAQNKQHVALRKVTLAELIESIRPQIPDGCMVRAIYSALTKPPLDGTTPEDIERVTTDDDLVNFLAVGDGMYKPLLFQVQLGRADRAKESPAPDDRPYFREDEFDMQVDPYDPIASDSENELYLIRFGRRKAKAWPRTDHGFEHGKARYRKKIGQFKRQLEEYKRRHKNFKGRNKDEILDSDEEIPFSWIKWLNP